MARDAFPPPAPSPGLVRRGWDLIERQARSLAPAPGRLWTEAWARSLATLHRAALAEPARALELARRGRRLFPRRRAFAEAEALLAARLQGWPAAAPLFERLAQRAPGGGSAAMLLRTAAPAPTLDLAVPAAARPARAPADLAARVVVYTAAFGRRPQLPPIAGDGPPVRFLCFTDHPVTAPGWDCRPGTGPEGDAPTREAFYRIRAEAALAAAAPDAEWSLYLAPDRLLLGNLDTLLTRWLLALDFAMWRHGAAADWHDLAERHLIKRSAPAAEVLAQALAFAAADLPRDAGAVDPGMIWRRHAAAPVAAFGEAWWAARAALPGPDDLTLCRVLHDPAAPPPIRPRILPARLGTATDNVYVAEAPRRPVARSVAARGRPAGARLPVSFLYAQSHARQASTFLRGEQLSAMVAAHHPDLYDVRYVAEAAALRDQVVVVTKGAMQTLAPDAIAALRARNVATIGCWDDVRPDPQKARLVDATMTLSHRQALDLNRLYPETPAFFVTHHVNPQVPAMTPPADRLRTGYFGELENTVRPDSLAGLVDLVGINSLAVNDSWLTALPHYNCHWIVRRRRPWDGWKPFLKGFVAARCGATIVVTRDDGDAAYYLGDDYPFYAPSLEAADLEMTLLSVASAFGGPDWRRGCEIMAQVRARSTDAHVCAEFKAMLDTILA